MTPALAVPAWKSIPHARHAQLPGFWPGLTPAQPRVHGRAAGRSIVARSHARHAQPRFGDEVNCHWPATGLTIELLSYRFRASRQAFERDVARRRRSNHVAYTYGDAFKRGAATIADLRPRRRLS